MLKTKLRVNSEKNHFYNLLQRQTKNLVLVQLLKITNYKFTVRVMKIHSNCTSLAIDSLLKKILIVFHYTNKNKN